MTHNIFVYLVANVSLAGPRRCEIISTRSWRLKIGEEFFTCAPGTPLGIAFAELILICYILFQILLRRDYVYINWAHGSIIVIIFGAVFLMELLGLIIIVFNLWELIVKILYPSMSEMRTFWNFFHFSFWLDKFVIIWRVRGLSTVKENLLRLDYFLLIHGFTVIYMIRIVLYNSVFQRLPAREKWIVIISHGIMLNRILKVRKVFYVFLWFVGVVQSVLIILYIILGNMYLSWKQPSMSLTLHLLSTLSILINYLICYIDNRYNEYYR